MSTLTAIETSIYKNLKGLLGLLNDQMCEAIARGMTEGTVIADSPWCYQFEELKPSGLVHRTPRGKKVEGTMHYTSYQWQVKPGWKTSQAIFERMMAEREQLEQNMAKELAKIPKLIDAEAGIVRWPVGLTLGWVDNGDTVSYVLSTCHIRESYNPYKPRPLETA